MAAAAPAGRRITSNKDQAGFVPIPPDIDVDGVIRDTANFKSVARIDALTLATDEDFEHVKNLIQNEVVKEGMPLVIENWHRRGDWPKWIFDPSWLRKNYGNAVINVRDIPNKKEIPMTYDHYLKNMPKLAGRFQAASFSKHQRLYAKDLDCPIIWRERLGEVIPPSTFYLNPEADLMSSLPHEARAENMMCYIGHEGTYTPAHKEMCASLGQNIMVHASEGAEQPGSSIWFMTRTKDRKAVAEYWLSSLGHDIEVEAHFASVADLQEAPFDVYIHEQKLGDYILVPPLAPHQVWNRGVTTIKAAWNRTTVDTLKHAMEEALPNARLVCRDEQYKNRDIIHDTLRKYTRILRGVEPQGELEIDKIQRDYVKLFKLFHKIVVNEMFSPTIDQPPVENIPREYNVQCSFCRGNIWNRFLSCKNCIIKDEDDGEDSAYDICLDCYARGRSCFCVSKLDWVQQHVWADLEEEHEEFRRQVISFNDIDAIVNAPSSLSVALDRLGEKTLAWVCQEQLLVRPWVDLTKNGLEEEEQDDEDSVQKKKRMGLSINCHVCKIRHDTWKSVKCSTCEKSYCYGNLWRAFDQDPFDDILKKFRWDCPVCELKCSCGACRKRPDMNPYMPKGTFLGAPTKHVADPRSTESLVDFARGNLNWIKDTGSGQGLINLKRKRGSLDLESEVFENGDSHAPVQEPAHGQEERSRQIPIDPALDIGISNGNANGTNNGNDFTPVNGASNEGNRSTDEQAAEKPKRGSKRGSKRGGKARGGKGRARGRG
ncbi:hypothetical protein EDC01DRAFT_369097 [Geopyxis carbonaria]|nr:hypothetical protein EDC01DRAFT_369097 [Geopyxis carbonaria]